MFNELILDNFAGGGGASLGIEWALGRSPDVAVNHDPEAIAMHLANHPGTTHLLGDVWEDEPKRVTGGLPVGLGWFSPDCTHFSQSKGGKPRDAGIRALAEILVRYAAEVGPRVMMMENVDEFRSWGPLDSEGFPIKSRAGEDYRRWWKAIEDCGYRGEARLLRAADYGSPTTRTRLFITWLRCDVKGDIPWPEPTHAKDGAGGLEPWHGAWECIDFSTPCPSIFERDEDLKDKTLARIATGLLKYVIDHPDPFVIPTTHHGDLRTHDLNDPFVTVTGANRGELALVAPFLTHQSNGERVGQTPRTYSVERPLSTVVQGGLKHGLAVASLVKNYSARKTGGWNGGQDLRKPFGVVTANDHHALSVSYLAKLKGTARHGSDARSPVPTVQARGMHHAEVRALLIKYYGTGVGQDLRSPLGTVTSHDRFALCTVNGEEYAITDVGFRMLGARELFRAQGFPDTYKIDPIYNGKPLTKTAQVKCCGNSVCPQLASALVRAVFAEQIAHANDPTPKMRAAARNSRRVRTVAA